MNLNKCFLTNNNCYKANQKITVKGIMVHSTGANNPNLKRYVQPNDGKLGNNPYGNSWNNAKPDGRSVCAHAFIGKLADGTIATYQTLPWDINGWHAGGSANNSYIGFEICEDGLNDKTYFDKVYKEAVELCVYLCKKFGLTEKDIICHSEGATKGIASSHGDVMHWFPKFGKNMNTFRADVKEGLEVKETTKSGTIYRVQVGAFSVKANAEAYVEKLKKAGFDAFITVVGDVDGDGKVTVADARSVLRESVGLK